MDPLTAIGVGSAVVGGLKGLFGGGKKRPDYRRAIAELRAARPVGYLTPEDMRAAELTRGRLGEAVTSEGRLGGYEIGRRFQARGLAGSPSEERARARLEQQTLLGKEHAGTAAEEQLYNIKTGREGFERQKALEIFGAQTSAEDKNYARAQAEQGAFWNSINEFLPTIIGGIGTGGGGGGLSPALTPEATGGYGDYLNTYTDMGKYNRGFQPEAQVGPRRGF